MIDYISRADVLNACHPVMPTDGVGTIGITYDEIKALPADEHMSILKDVFGDVWLNRKMFLVNRARGTVDECTVGSVCIYWDFGFSFIVISQYGERSIHEKDEIGKILFFDRAEAESALAEKGEPDAEVAL